LSVPLFSFPHPFEKFFQEILKKGLQFPANRAILCKLTVAEAMVVGNVRVWRSLVSRLNGVQEALSSNLNTRTKKKRLVSYEINRFFISKIKHQLWLLEIKY
jgi:hypothetical protein